MNGERHDLFLRALAVMRNQKTMKRPRVDTDPKWPEHVLAFDTETRTSADQSLTFGVYRRCLLVGDSYEVKEEGIWYSIEFSSRFKRNSTFFRSASLFVIWLVGPITCVLRSLSSCPGTSIQYWK